MSTESKNKVDEYFNVLKSKKETITEKDLSDIMDNAMILAKNYKATGQEKALDKLLFKIGCLEKEVQLVQMGINTFVYRQDIVDYAQNIKDNEVCLIELRNYEREIPQEIVETIEKVKDIFDQLYIVYTDYTGKESKRIEAEERAKDPILFGAFGTKYNATIVDRFYFLGDWVDEYCDLTFDRMLEEFAKEKKFTMNNELAIPKTLDELKDQLDMTKKTEDVISETSPSSAMYMSFNTTNNNSTTSIMTPVPYVTARTEDVKPPKKRFVDKIRSILKGNK